MTDMAEWLKKNHREIGRRAGGRSMLLRRTYQAPVEDVWAACTQPERLARWLLPVHGDLRPGGTYALDGNAHGEILRCEPPSRLTVSWKYGDLPDSEVELRLSPAAPGATTLELEHYLLPDDGVTGVGTGWELPLTITLTLYLRGELPDSVVAEWYEPGEEQLRLSELVARTWLDLARAHDLPIPDMPSHWA